MLRRVSSFSATSSFFCAATLCQIDIHASPRFIQTNLSQDRQSVFEVMSRNVLLVIAAGTATALLSYFGTGLHPIWSLLWFAPVPVLALASRLRASSAFSLGLIAWLIGETNLWNFYRHAIELPLTLIVVAFALPAVVFGLAVLVTRRFLRSNSLFSAALALPLLWITYEYVTAVLSPHSTSGNLAYSQMNFLPLIQIASITGIWGISFIVFLFGGTIATLLSGAGIRRSVAHSQSRPALSFARSFFMADGDYTRRLPSHPSPSHSWRRTCR